MSMYVYIYIYMYIYIYIYIYIQTYIDILDYTYSLLYPCPFFLIYIYIHTHIYIHTYTYIQYLFLTLVPFCCFLFLARCAGHASRDARARLHRRTCRVRSTRTNLIYVYMCIYNLQIPSIQPRDAIPRPYTHPPPNHQYKKKAVILQRNARARLHRRTRRVRSARTNLIQIQILL